MNKSTDMYQEASKEEQDFDIKGRSELKIWLRALIERPIQFFLLSGLFFILLDRIVCRTASCN